MTTHTASPVTTLAAAIESRDPRAILLHYAEDATLVVLDRDHPPTTPQTITGRAAIGDYYQDVCARNIEHEVREAVSTSTGLAYTSTADTPKAPGWCAPPWPPSRTASSFTRPPCRRGTKPETAQSSTLGRGASGASSSSRWNCSESPPNRSAHPSSRSPPGLSALLS